MARPRRLGRVALMAGVLLLLFAAAWAPRFLVLDTFVTADESKWLNRSGTFYWSLAHGDLMGTFQREHPGVPILWAGMLGYLQRFPEYAQQVSGPITDLQLEKWLREATTHTPLELLAAGRSWVVLAIALAITACFFPLRRLFGAKVAVLGVLAIAWGPFMMSLGFELHPIGLTSALIVLTFLSFLAWLYAGRPWSYLVLSGVTWGLALLTQTLAAVVAPVAGLLTLVELVRSWRSSEARARWQLIALLVIWGGLAAAAFVALWPAMWFNPVWVMQQIAGQLGAYAQTPHKIGYYFLGSPTSDPGLLFYPAVLALRSTPFTCIGLLLGAVWAVRGVWPLATGPARRSFWAMPVFAVLYTLAIIIAAKKAGRYLLPVFPLLDVAALLGWLATGYVLARWWQRRQARTAQAAAAPTATAQPVRQAQTWAALATGAVLLLAHAAPGFATYPYYLTYYNPLAGGTKAAEAVIGVGWGEGLDQAARWLNQQPDADKLRVVSWYGNGALSYFLKSNEPPGDFLGAGLWFDYDYMVTYINQWERQNPEPDIFTYLDTQTPAFVARANGIELARVYDLRGKAPPPFTDLYTDHTGTFGDDLRLAAYKLRSFAAQPGDTVKTNVYLKALRPVTAGYLAQMQLVGPGGEVVWQQERQPANLSTRGWAAGEIRTDEYRIPLPATLAPGLYTLEYGLADRETGVSAPLQVTRGAASAGGERLQLAQVRVDAPPRTAVDIRWDGAAITAVQHPAEVRPGDTLLVLTEQAQEAGQGAGLKLSLRLVDATGAVAVQQDKDLAPELRWTLKVPQEVAPGAYTLAAILYQADTLQALPDASGQLQSQLGSVEVSP